MNVYEKNLEKNIFQIGFDVVGYAKPSVDEEARKEYLSFLNKNYHGEMKWLERHFEKKVEPKKIWDIVKVSMKESVMIMFIIAASYLFAFTLSQLYVTQSLAQSMVELSSNKWVVFILINI